MEDKPKKIMPKRTSDKGLGRRHQKFIEEYIRGGFNGTRAYKAVYPGVTDETAGANACRLLRDARVTEGITLELKKDLRGKTTREYLSGRLFELSQDSKREADRIRALELIAKLSGLLSDNQTTQVNVLSTDALTKIKEKLKRTVSTVVPEDKQA